LDQLEELIADTKKSLNRMVDLNKSISNENSNLQSSVNILEEDLS